MNLKKKIEKKGGQKKQIHRDEVFIFYFLF